MHEDGRVSRTIRVAYSSRMLAYSNNVRTHRSSLLRDAFEAGRVPGSELTWNIDVEPRAKFPVRNVVGVE